ncbi:hypothetical protein [Agriterribacter humi]|jgi:hypothetical protein|uniref:hypothetical protein n=1 Tax=Agriterribacter humi TaxID=1104781 RepID=UPI001265519F|nr:hypothetical protein [Agriterribacter humi]
MLHSEKAEQYITNLKSEIVGKGTYRRAIWFAIFMTIPCIGILTDPIEGLIMLLKKDYILMPILLLLIYGNAIFFWFKVFDKNIKLIINPNGIWTKATGFIMWDNFWYYYLRERHTNKAGTFRDLIFKLRNDEKEYKVNITYLDIDYKQIQKAIQLNAKDHGVNELSIDTNK